MNSSKKSVLAVALVAMLCTPVAAAPVQKPDQSLSVQRICNSKPPARRAAPAVGKCFDGWLSHQPLKDFAKRGLLKPKKGQIWVQNSGFYILIEVSSGLIIRLVTERR